MMKRKILFLILGFVTVILIDTCCKYDTTRNKKIEVETIKMTPLTSVANIYSIKDTVNIDNFLDNYVDSMKYNHTNKNLIKIKKQRMHIDSLLNKKTIYYPKNVNSISERKPK